MSQSGVPKEQELPETGKVHAQQESQNTDGEGGYCAGHAAKADTSPDSEPNNARKFRLLAYIGITAALAFSIGGACLPTWLNFTFEHDDGNTTDVNLGMWRSCFGSTCSSRADYNWGYGRATSVGYMRPGILVLRAWFLLQPDVISYFFGILSQHRRGVMSAAEARYQLGICYVALATVSFLTSFWFFYAYDALDGGQVSNREVGVGWILQFVSSGIVLLLCPCVLFSSYVTQIPKESSEGHETKPSSATFQTRTDKLRKLFDGEIVRLMLIFISFVFYATAISSPQWTVEQQDIDGVTQNTYKGPWMSCEDNAGAENGELSMTCSEPYKFLARHEIPMVANTQTVSTLGSLLILSELFFLLLGYGKILQERTCRHVLIWLTCICAATIPSVAASWGRQFMLIFTLKGDDAPDSQVDSRVFGVAWWLLWPAFVFQLLSIFAAYAWQTPALTKEDGASENIKADESQSVISRVCCCRGNWSTLKVIVYIVGTVSYLLLYSVLGTDNWTRVSFTYEGANIDVSIGPMLACVELAGFPNNGNNTLCENGLLALLGSEQLESLESGTTNAQTLMKERIDNGADVATCLDSTGALLAAAATATILAIVMFMFRETNKFPFEVMSKIVGTSFSMAALLALLAPCTWAYIYSNIKRGGAEDVSINAGANWVISWLPFVLLAILTIFVQKDAKRALPENSSQSNEVVNPLRDDTQDEENQ